MRDNSQLSSDVLWFHTTNCLPLFIIYSRQCLDSPLPFSWLKFWEPQNSPEANEALLLLKPRRNLDDTLSMQLGCVGGCCCCSCFVFGEQQSHGTHRKEDYDVEARGLSCTYYGPNLVCPPPPAAIFPRRKVTICTNGSFLSRAKSSYKQINLDWNCDGERVKAHT